MKTLDDLFKPRVPNRDFGWFKRRSLNDKEFLFKEPIAAHAFVRIDEETFMLMSTYHHSVETFDVTIYFSKPQILVIANGVLDVCPELSMFLLDQYKQPFSLETADFMEIDFPYGASIWITLSARLLIEFEHEYRAAGDADMSFLPFKATHIHKCETEDWLA